MLRVGRQYQRQLSNFGAPFALAAAGELITWSRILDDEEALCVVNGHGAARRGGDVVVDARLNAAGTAFEVVASSEEAGTGATPSHHVGDRVPVRRRLDGTAFVEIRDVGPSEVRRARQPALTWSVQVGQVGQVGRVGTRSPQVRSGPRSQTQELRHVVE